MNTRKPLTLRRLREMHAGGDKIAMLTCYDAMFARFLDAAGVDDLVPKPIDWEILLAALETHTADDVGQGD